MLQAVLVQHGFALDEIDRMTDPQAQSYLRAIRQLHGGKAAETEQRRYVSTRKRS